MLITSIGICLLSFLSVVYICATFVFWTKKLESLNKTENNLYNCMVCCCKHRKIKAKSSPRRQRRPARGEQETAGRSGDALPPRGPALLPAAGARSGAGAKHTCCGSPYSRTTVKCGKILIVNTETEHPPHLTLLLQTARHSRFKNTSSSNKHRPLKKTLLPKRRDQFTQIKNVLD